MLAIVLPYRRHLRATGVLGLLALLVFLAGGASHVVQFGDTLGDIAQDYNVSLSTLIEENNIRNPDLILVGQVLEIPGTVPDPGDSDTPDVSENGSRTVTHTVVRGEALSRIAARYGVTVSAIAAANNIPNLNLIRPGQQIIVPANGPFAGTNEPAPLYHVVQRGETLASISSRYELSISQLASANGMSTTTQLITGARLRLIAPEPFEPEGIGSIEYVVKSGDRVGDLAFEHGTTITEIVRLNNLRNANLIRPGQVLLLPATGWVCPVPDGGFINDWGYPRSGGRFHQGTDVFAPFGTAVYAPVSGHVTQVVGSLGGNQFTLKGDDSHTYYGTHLDSFDAQGRVSAGAQLGTVGDSGNARGGKPHLHFEIYANGVEAVNPYPTLVEACR